jgi:hypothetical protein
MTARPLCTFAARTGLRFKQSLYLLSSQAGEILKKVTTAKLHAQYAKAREADGSYREAAAAYLEAKDYLAVVRINLDHLRNPDAAVEIVKVILSAPTCSHFFRRSRALKARKWLPSSFRIWATLLLRSSFWCCPNVRVKRSLLLRLKC